MQAGETSFVPADVSDEPEEEEEEEEELEKVKIRFAVFFDGTCNNRNNTEQRERAQKKDAPDDEMHRKAKEIYEKYKSDDSYDNDLTNIAKMEKCIDKEDDYQECFAAYIEGPGTEDDQGDSTAGYAFGLGGTGVRSKVKKGLDLVIEKVTEKVDSADEIIELLTLDVFGFSRGAAGARNFIYEAKFGDEYKSIKSQLVEQEYKVKKIEIRFVGLYDTVSSHGIIYCNDVSDLKLTAVRHAKTVIHLAAADEHRSNFSLTNINSALNGREIFLPGVHSDVGGSYCDGKPEKHMIYYGPESIARRDREDLIRAGWFTEKEITLTTMEDEDWTDAVVEVDRVEVSSQYSRIPLHIMAKFARENKLNIQPLLEDDDPINGKTLTDAKKRIDKYIAETDPKKTPKKKSTAEDWHHDNEQLLHDLRHDYFHFSAKWELGLTPRMSFWTSTRYRKMYNG